MSKLLQVATTGLTAIRLHPLRSLVCVVALASVLVPYLTGVGLAQGLEQEAEKSAQFGADLYLTGSRFGRPVPIPESVADWVRRVEGVTEVLPRVVGEVCLGKEKIPAVLVGLPASRLSAWTACLEGALPQAGSAQQVVVGTALARQLALEPGSKLPPFYRNDSTGEKLTEVVGVFRPDAPLWQANVILTTYETAVRVFDQTGYATDLLVWCRPGYQAAVSRTILRDAPMFRDAGQGAVRPALTAREDLLALLPRGMLHLEGLFNLQFLAAFAVAILVLLVTSGLGLAERRREIGILKATGWQTDEILLRGLVESVVLSLTAASVALILAWVWLRLLNGIGIAGLFLAGVGIRPEFTIPFRLTPIPALLGFVFALVIVLTGSLISSWRAATTAPRVSMR